MSKMISRDGGPMVDEEKALAAMDAEDAYYRLRLDAAVSDARAKLKGDDRTWLVFMAIARVVAIDRLRCENAKVSTPTWEETLKRERLPGNALVAEFMRMERRGGRN